MHVETEGWGLRKWSLVVCLRRAYVGRALESSPTLTLCRGWIPGLSGSQGAKSNRSAVFVLSLLFFYPNWLWSKQRNVSFGSHGRVHDTHTSTDTSTCSPKKICMYMQMQSQYIVVRCTLTAWHTYRHILYTDADACTHRDSHAHGTWTWTRALHKATRASISYFAGIS